MGRGSNWTVDDDELLCRGWLSVSQDCVTGNQQKNAAFWKKIMVFINKDKVEGDYRRSQKSAQSRWKTINSACARYAGVYAQVQETYVSGANAEDTERAACAAYRVDGAGNGKSFEFKECWTILRENAKWANPPPEMVNSNSANDEGGPASVEVGDQAPVVGAGVGGHQAPTLGQQSRPIGVKRTKLDLNALKVQQKIYEELKEANVTARERKMDFKMSLAFSYFSVPEHEIPEGSRALFAFSKAQLIHDLSQTPAGAVFFGGSIPARADSPVLDDSNEVNEDEDQVGVDEDQVGVDEDFDLRQNSVRNVPQQYDIEGVVDDLHLRQNSVQQTNQQYEREGLGQPLQEPGLFNTMLFSNIMPQRPRVGDHDEMISEESNDDSVEITGHVPVSYTALGGWDLTLGGN